jgi:hypothetical protein
VVGLAVATGGWVPGVGPANTISRMLGAVAGLFLLYLAPPTIAIGVVALALAAGVAAFAHRRGDDDETTHAAGRRASADETTQSETGSEP